MTRPSEWARPTADPLSRRRLRYRFRRTAPPNTRPPPAWALLSGSAGKVPAVALHATTIRFADRTYTAIALAADAQGISVSQYVREAALIRAVLDELDS